MAYLGQGPFQEYSSIPTKDNFTGDGSTVAFDLASAVPSNGENGLEVFVSNTRQQPGSGKHFTLGQDGSGDFKRITFASAPSNGAEIYVINDKTNTTTLAPLSADMNGAELILDVDGDSSITADTDDRIDIKLSGVEHISFGNSSGDTVIKPMVDAKDILFQQYDGRTLLDINDGGYVAIANGATGPGQLRFYEDTDLGTNFTAFQVGTQSADITYTLPTADGTSGYLLSTDGNGVLSWAVAGSLSGAAFTNDGNNRVTTGTGSSTINGEANLTFDGSTLAVTGATTVSTTLGVTGILTGSNTVIGTTFEPTGDTSSSDNAAVGYTAAEGLILTGQGSTNDVTIKNDADGTVMSIPTGTTGVTFAGTVGSGAITSTGIVTGTGFTAGSAVLAEAELELLDGLTAGTAIASKVVTTDANIDSTGMRNLTITGTFSDGNYTFDTSGNVSGLGTLASGAITSSGAIAGASLTADDVAIDGKVITMTGSASDTAVLTAGTNGTLSIVTTDAAAAAANITITADGTAELAGTTVTLNSGAGVTIDADNGTITFADAGSSLGTITSSGYSGTAAVATTVTITDNENTDENNAIIFTAGGDVDGGNIGLESDGDLTYNPSSGTLNVPNISVTGTQTIVNSVTMNASNAVIFEGSTADAYETTLSTVDATADITINLPNVAGTLPVLAAASTTAITATPAEINLIDGGTSRGTTAVASGDGILINDGGTMAMTNVDTVSTYFASHSVGGGNIVTTGALNSGSITSGFGAIDNGTSNIRSATITAETAFVPDASGGADLVTTSLEFNDAYFNDAAVINFGDDQDVTLTHVVDTGLLLNSTMALQFNDASQYINAPSATILDINATDEIELNATLVDINANVECSGTMGVGGVLTTSAAIAGSTAEFSGAVTIQGAVIINEDSADVDTRIESNGNTHMFFVDGGADHVNIGTSSDLGGILNVNGTIYGPGAVGLNSGDYHAFTDNTDQRFVVNGNEEMRLEADGDLHVDGDVIAFSTTISDATLKYNINPIEFALDKVKQLKGVTFNYFKDNRESAGLLAQDVEKVMPSAVSERKLPLHTGDDKAYKTLHYDSIHALLIESIKELTTKLEESTKRIETLENR